MRESETKIFKAHLLTLEDPEFIEQIKLSIEKEKVNAAYATQKIMDQFVATFKSMEDVYPKERAADMKDVGTRLIKYFRNCFPRFSIYTRRCFDHRP